ncbi:MAG: YcxB family protein [Cognaticolwellia sp.]
MTQAFNYQTSFILDKSHFSECYDESAQAKTFTMLYSKALILLLVGAGLVLFSELNQYAAWFIFSLGVLELVSNRYRKAWWLARQMLSKAAKAEVKLTIDEQRIQISSFYNDTQLLFSKIDCLTATENGWLITQNGIRHYISNRCLSAGAKHFLFEKSNEERTTS